MRWIYYSLNESLILILKFLLNSKKNIPAISIPNSKAKNAHIMLNVYNNRNIRHYGVRINVVSQG